MPTVDRMQLQEALRLIASQGARFGEPTVATAVNVLQERLAALPVEDVAHEAAIPSIEQRKQITILFAAVEGFTRLTGISRHTARLRQIDRLWQQLDETILNYGGVVDKHMGDVIMGIFGAPVARENDPERAVRCAMALMQILSEFPAIRQQETGEIRPVPLSEPATRIGINTGQVSLGQVGSDAGQTVIGDAVNVASRLKEASDESGIYISQDTYRLVRNLFGVETLGEVSIKGRQTPVTVYRVLDALPQLFFPALEGVEDVHVPLIGRDVEIATLKQLLEQTLQKNEGRFITLIGDAGVGKSRLMREFHRSLESLPFKPVVFQARTDQRLSGVSFSLMRDLFIRHFGIDEGDGAAVVEDKIMNALAAMEADHERNGRHSDWRERARRLSVLVGLETPTAHLQVRDSLDSSAVWERSIEEIEEYLLTVMRRSPTTLFFLEDIHWADDDSLALLEKITAATTDTPCLMLCMARPTLLERRPDWPGANPVGAWHLPVRPLAEAATRELVGSILRKLPHIPSALVDLIIRSAVGNPYYVEELVRVLIEDGFIVPDSAGWYLRPRELTRLRVPGTLTGVLQARLDRLPEIERVTLQQAAVIGDEFWADALQLINRAARFPFAEAQVKAALDSLESRDMIIRVSASVFPGSQAYLFRHTLLREVAYESVLLRDRTAYHLQAVRWLEAQVGDRLPEYAALIAQHYEQAGHPAKSALMYEQAAVRAEKQFKLTVAIEYYRKALDMLRNLPHYFDSRLTIKERMGQLMQRRGRMVEALEIFRVMHDNAELDGNLLAQTRAKNAQAEIFLELDDNRNALDAAVQAEKRALLSGAELELALAQRLQAEAAGRLGDSAGAIDKANQSLDRGQSLNAPRGVARSLALLAGLLEGPHERRTAAADLNALAEVLEARGDRDDAAFAMTRLAEVMINLENYREARTALQRALAHLRSVGDQRGMAEALRLLGVVECRSGDTTSAIGHLEEAGALAEATGNRYLRLACRLAMGESLLAHGQLPAAEATLRQVIAAAEDRRRLGNWVNMRRAKVLLVEALNRQGRIDEARWIEERL